MSTCNSATQLYCSPDKNDLCFDNETYSLTFNSKFSTLNAKKLVDIYLFHGDDGTIAMEFPSRENDGDYPFTIDEVGISGVLLTLDLVYGSSCHNDSILSV